MNAKTIIIISLVVLAGYLYFKAPSAASIAEEMKVDIIKGTISYDGITYAAQWDEQVVYSGDIRDIGRAYDKYAPYITNDAVVTTGEFSDPSIVSVSPIRNGNMSWFSKKEPEGSLIVLHFIPVNFLVYEKLARIQTGQKVELVGREEIDSKIEGPDGRTVSLGHSNHKFFVLERIR
jgi:hypothetical protein